MTGAQLKAALVAAQEPKGYYFNHDSATVDSVLEQLLIVRQRYGYMACPCRLSSGNREKDKDIICPCVYRQADVAEYGACFCGLYTTKEFNEQKLPTPVVPDRRPVTNIF